MKALFNWVSMMAMVLGASLHAADKTLIDYFLPMPIQGSLVSNVWGAPDVFARDPQNGLEALDRDLQKASDETSMREEEK